MRPPFQINGPLLTLLIILFAVRVEAIAACRRHSWDWVQNGKTTKLSFAIDLRTKSRPIPSGPTVDYEVNGIPQSITQNDCRTRVPSVATHHCWERKPEPKKPAPPAKPPKKKPPPWTPKYETDAGMRTGPPAKCTSKTTIPDYTCDHILELNFLQRVMEAPGGACDKAVAETNSKFTYDKAMGKLRDIRHLMNNWENLSLHQGKTVDPTDPTSLALAGSPEDFKTRTVRTWVNGGGITQAAEDVWKLGGLDNYINMREKKVLTAIGTTVDTKIKQLFPGATDGLHDEWQRFQGDVAAAFKAAAKAHKQQLLAAAKAEEECANPAAGGSTTQTTRRLARRHVLGIRSDSNHQKLWQTPGGVISSLTERARRAAPRTGPKAPRAKSCPCKQVPAKKQVPRSKVKQRPPPAKKPRVPANRPPIRKPTRPKQVAKRPANRPRRTPGTKATPRRPSPKRTPKKVPRPTQRPKGKPRTRRRR